MTHSDENKTICIYVDADACPVKNETYKVAERHGIRTIVVANSFIAIPRDEPLIERVIVPAGLDVADDWIAERSRAGAVVITADIPLAHRAVTAGAVALAPDGRLFNAANIGNILATRNLMDELRSANPVSSGQFGGSKPFSPRDRSAFLSALDLAIVRLKRDSFTA
ncbi:YaiI/YqxD family protein [Ochrobactrum sp. MR34]|nr:YaiI/YqxD family protein [Ochrobactrum sp. MR34]